MIPFTIDHVKTNIAGPPVGVKSKTINLNENSRQEKAKLLMLREYFLVIRNRSEKYRVYIIIFINNVV